VSFDVDAREWNGRWFGELMAWRVQIVGGQQQAQQPTAQSAIPSPQPQAQNTQVDDSNLPF
jgi:hypothetical protein